MSEAVPQPHAIHVLYATRPPRHGHQAALAHFFTMFAHMGSDDQKASLTLATLSLENEQRPDFDHEDAGALARERDRLQMQCRRAIQSDFLSEEAFTHFFVSSMLAWCWHFANPQNTPRSAERLRRAAELSGDPDLATFVEERANNVRGEALGWQRRYEALCTSVVRSLLDPSELLEL